MHDLFPMQAPTPSIAAVIKHHKAKRINFSQFFATSHITPGDRGDRRWRVDNPATRQTKKYPYP
eukprot:scaffold294717_cov106-Cyclotella_meneghiniana.AAC.1